MVIQLDWRRDKIVCTYVIKDDIVINRDVR